jgi:hypothetical protein
MMKKMSSDQFEAWWFEKGGQDIADARFGKNITFKDIKKQPSYKLFKDKDNAFAEALWDKAYRKMVKVI